MLRALIAVTVSIFFVPVCSAQEDVSDCFPMEKQLRLDAGVGSESGIHAGGSWHIPLSQIGDNRISMEMAVGFDPFRSSFVPSAGFTWSSINWRRSMGGSLSVLVTINNWEDNGTPVERGIIGIAPGLLMKWGCKLVNVRIGPAIVHVTRSNDEVAESTIWLVADLRLSFQSPW